MRQMRSSCANLQGVTYKASFKLDLCFQQEGQGIKRLVRRFGLLPIMVRSVNCYLRKCNR